MKFHVPNYSCLQNPWLGGYRPQIPVLPVLCPQLNLLNPPPEQNSWIRRWQRPLPSTIFWIRHHAIISQRLYIRTRPHIPAECDDHTHRADDPKSSCMTHSFPFSVTQFLGAKANLRKATISFVISIRLSVHMEQLGSHWMDFHEIWYSCVFFFSKIWREISSYIKIWQEWRVLYMKANVNLW